MSINEIFTYNQGAYGWRQDDVQGYFNNQTNALRLVFNDNP